MSVISQNRNKQEREGRTAVWIWTEGGGQKGFAAWDRRGEGGGSLGTRWAVLFPLGLASLQPEEVDFQEVDRAQPQHRHVVERLQQLADRL